MACSRIARAGAITLGSALGAWSIGVRADFTVNMAPGVTAISREVYDQHMLIFWICVTISAVVFRVTFGRSITTASRAAWWRPSSTMLFSPLMFFIGGSFALVIQAELFQPGLQIVNPYFFNQFTTLHALVMMYDALCQITGLNSKQHVGRARCLW